MSEEPGAGPGQIGAPRQDEGLGAGTILLGIFLILFGLCLTLAGGGCTALWIIVMFNDGSVEGGGLLLLSLAVLAAGLATLWVSVKMLSGKYRK
jgi:hypothetical protein